MSHAGRTRSTGTRSAGIRFAFVKVTQGAREVDPRFEENWAALARTRIVRGAYHFLEPDVDGAVQARHFLAHVKPTSGELLPAVDVEKAGPRLHRTLLDYVGEIRKRTGLEPIIYASPAFWNDHVAPHLEEALPTSLDCRVRRAHAEGTNRIGPWSIWQYSEEGRVPGIDGKVDRDRAQDLRAITIPWAWARRSQVGSPGRRASSRVRSAPLTMPLPSRSPAQPFPEQGPSCPAAGRDPRPDGAVTVDVGGARRLIGGNSMMKPMHVVVGGVVQSVSRTAETARGRLVLVLDREVPDQHVLVDAVAGCEPKLRR